MGSLPTVAILAGGLATRLRPLTEKIPKALIPINGRPFIDHQLELLRGAGVENVVICAGFAGDQIAVHVGDGRSFGLCVRYSFDGPVLLGTGGAIVRALALLGREFLVLYGDSYLECDYGAVVQAFRHSGRLALMTVFNNGGRWDRSNVEFRDGTIVAYNKQQQTPAMKHIDYGLGVFRREAFSGTAEQPVDLASVYQEMLRRGELAGFEVDRRFYEVGSHTGIAELSAHLEERQRPWNS